MIERAFYQLEIRSNATFRRVLSWGRYPYPVESCDGILVNANTGKPAREADFQPVDLTGCTARMQIRDKPDGVVLFQLSTAPGIGDGTITLGGSTGRVTLDIDEALTAAMTWKSGVWDLLIFFPVGDVERLAEGSVSVIPGVTKIA